MTKLNINIKVNEIEEIAPVIESVKKLELNKIPECNPVVTVELEVQDWKEIKYYDKNKEKCSYIYETGN